MDPYNFCLGNEKCPVCEAPFLLPARLLKSYNKSSFYILKYCLECSSFSNIPSTEDDLLDSGKKNNTYIDWHLQVSQRNEGYADVLLKTLRAELEFTSILEIGCGIGTFLKIAKKQGYDVTGFDLDQASINYGIDQYGLPLQARHFNREAVSKKYSLVVCISTLEHLREPRTLIREIAGYCQDNSAAAFVYVPFFGNSERKYLLDPESEDKANPFSNNDEHVIHFSKKGFLKAFADFGLDNYLRLMPEVGWRGVLFKNTKSKAS